MLGRVDLAVVVLDQPVRGLTRTPLLNEQLFLIRHPDMATEMGATCSLAELARLPLVLISPPNIVRTKLDRAFAAAQLDYNLVAVVNSTSMLVSWVERGVGATVLPWSAVHEQVTSGRLIATPLDGDEWQRDLWLCHAESLPITPAGEIVQGLIIQDVQRRLVPGAWLGLAVWRRWTRPEASLQSYPAPYRNVIESIVNLYFSSVRHPSTLCSFIRVLVDKNIDETSTVTSKYPEGTWHCRCRESRCWI